MGGFLLDRDIHEKKKGDKEPGFEEPEGEDKLNFAEIGLLGKGEGR